MSLRPQPVPLIPDETAHPGIVNSLAISSLMAPGEIPMETDHTVNRRVIMRSAHFAFNKENIERFNFKYRTALDSSPGHEGGRQLCGLLRRPPYRHRRDR